MTFPQILNLIGLFFITAGSIAAAIGSPSPKYNLDGSVSLADEPDKDKRIAIYWWQKNFRNFLFMLAFGASLQAIAIFLPTGNGS